MKSKEYPRLYELRTKKFVSRKLFVDMLRRIDRWRPMSQYAYLGFGGPSLEDHKLLKQELNLSRLISIEAEPDVFARQRFNVPLDSLICHHLKSSELIAQLDSVMDADGSGAEENVIVWLDYVTPREIKAQLGELKELIGKLQSGDIVKITINANPASLGAAIREGYPDLHSSRYACLVERMGDLLPVDAVAADVETSRYPALLFRVISRVCSQAMEGRDVTFVPILQEVYADGQQMLSVAGIVLSEDQIQEFLDLTNFSSWEFYSDFWTLVEHIDFPDLTIRERLRWDSLPEVYGEGDIAKEFSSAFGSEGDALTFFRAYKRYQRFLPHFHHINY